MSSYENNIDAIKKVAPQLAKLIAEAENPNWCELVYSEKRPNLLIKRGSKKELVYSKSGSRKKIKDTLKQLELPQDGATVLVGIGLGFLAKEILSKMDKKHRLIIVEPVPQLLKYSFELNDYSKYISQGSLVFASPGQVEIAMIIGVLENSTVIMSWHLIFNEYIHKRPDEYSKIAKYTLETINQVRCNTGTVMGAGKIIADNDIANMPYVIRHRGIAELKNLFENKPAVLICTGPSLERNIWELQNIQNKVIIIAVAQALRILLAYDIRPDFITTVDFGKTNLGHYKGLMHSDVPLVCLNRTYAEILKQYQGPKFIVATPVPGYEHSAAHILSDKGHIDSGGSVAHLSMMLAYFMGCNPVIMIGQDLALTDSKSHFAQADECGIISADLETGGIAWEVKDHRSHLVKEKKSDKPIYSMGAPLSVPGYFGTPVITNSGLASFILAFKNLIEAYFPKNGDKIIIDATEGGAKIDGTLRLSLHKSIESYCKDPIDKTALNPLLSLAEDADGLIEKVIPLLKEDIKTLDIIETEAQKGIKWGIRAKNWKGNPAKIKKSIKENEIHSMAAYNASKKNPLVTVAIFNESRLIQSKELKVKGKMRHLLKNNKDFLTRIKRNKLILTAAKKAAVSLKKSYKDTLNILEKYQKTKDESLLTIKDDYIPNIEDAFSFFKRGNFARPLLEAREIKKIDLDFDDSANQYAKACTIKKIATDLREKSIKKAKRRQRKNETDKLLKYLDIREREYEIGKEELKKEKPNFTKSCELLKEALDLYPDNENCLWGYATALHHNCRFEDSLIQYKKLIEKIQKETDKLNFSDRQKEFLKIYSERHREDDIEIQKKNQKKITKVARLIKKEQIFNELNKKLLLYKYEYGQVMIISSKVQDGLRIIHEVMKETDEFDSFFQRIGDLYNSLNDTKKALIAYNSYLRKFPDDYVVWEKKGLCHNKLEEFDKANKAFGKAMKIKPTISVSDSITEEIRDHILSN